MVYTVGEMAKLLGVAASTLRYYDKEGLLPFVERSSGGIRMFRESDIEWLQVIGCMKKAGMSIKDIRQYIEMALQGDDTIDLRLAMFQRQHRSSETADGGIAAHHGDGGLQVLVLRNGEGSGYGRCPAEDGACQSPGTLSEDSAGAAHCAGDCGNDMTRLLRQRQSTALLALG